MVANIVKIYLGLLTLILAFNGVILLPIGIDLGVLIYSYKCLVSYSSLRDSTEYAHIQTPLAPIFKGIPRFLLK